MRRLSQSPSPSVRARQFTPIPIPSYTHPGLKLYSILDLERLGFRYPQPHSPPDPQDVATFSYTSGTTGGPKGALLTHANFLCVYAAGKALEVENFPDDVHFSYLPLPHVFERVMLLAVLGNGAAMGFWQGSAEKLVEDLQALRPTCMPAVPRVLNRIYDKVMAGVRASSPVKQALFWRAYRAKLADLDKGDLTKVGQTTTQQAGGGDRRSSQSVTPPTQSIDHARTQHTSTTGLLGPAGVRQDPQGHRPRPHPRHAHRYACACISIDRPLLWAETHVLTLTTPIPITTGSAPLAPHVLTFMRILCACPIHEGYGQTETTAMTTITFPGDWTTGHVGGVAPVCEVRGRVLRDPMGV